jgi:hypothetical protein
MKHWDETGSPMPICRFLMPHFIGIEHGMRRYIVDPLNASLKIIKNRYRWVVLRWHFLAGLDMRFSL